MKDEKILSEEILSDDELDKVSGGYDYEVFDDAQTFRSLGIKIGTFDYISESVFIK